MRRGVQQLSVLERPGGGVRVPGRVGQGGVWVGKGWYWYGVVWGSGSLAG